jgi:hypothetical protein
MRVLCWALKWPTIFSRRLGPCACVELVRIDIITEVSILSTFLCMRWGGHLDDVYYVFAYPSQDHNAREVFDPAHPRVGMCAFIKTDW